MNSYLQHPTMACVALLICGCASQSNLPEETADGLQRVDDAEVGALYVRPGVDFSSFSKIGLAPCQVSFRKNWMRDYNRDEIDLDDRVTQEDVDRIRSTLAAACDKHFKAALQEEPAYTLVQSFNQGEPVLIIAPAIANLEVNAPDLQTAGMERMYTTSAGEMTLLLEAIDGTTRQVLAEVADRQEDIGMGGTLEWTSSVTNRAEADRMLRSWAKQLREALDRAMRHEST
jgi:hypothetical protein